MADETLNVAVAAVAQNFELPCSKQRGQWCFGAAGSGHAARARSTHVKPENLLLPHI